MIPIVIIAVGIAIVGSMLLETGQLVSFKHKAGHTRAVIDDVAEGVIRAARNQGITFSKTGDRQNRQPELLPIKP